MHHWVRCPSMWPVRRHNDKLKNMTVLLTELWLFLQDTASQHAFTFSLHNKVPPLVVSLTWPFYILHPLYLKQQKVTQVHRLPVQQCKSAKYNGEKEKTQGTELPHPQTWNINEDQLNITSVTLGGCKRQTCGKKKSTVGRKRKKRVCEKFCIKVHWEA